MLWRRGSDTVMMDVQAKQAAIEAPTGKRKRGTTQQVGKYTWSIAHSSIGFS